jgi:hypothetical protein
VPFQAQLVENIEGLGESLVVVTLTIATSLSHQNYIVIKGEMNIFS